MGLYGGVWGGGGVEMWCVTFCMCIVCMCRLCVLYGGCGMCLWMYVYDVVV